MMRHVAGVVDVAGIEPKQTSTGLARMSAMLSRKMTPLVEAYQVGQLSDGEIWTTHEGVNPYGLVVLRDVV
jgi:hypothetical protein